MSDDRKRILSPLTRCKKACKRKAWHKTREKYIPVEGRQNLAETDRGIILQREWIEEFLDSQGAFYNGNESDNDDESYNENNEQQHLPKGFAKSCNKMVSKKTKKLILQKLINDFVVYKHQKHCSGKPSYAEDANHGFGS